MAINKVIYGGDVLVDLTGDTVSPEQLLEGSTAHNKAGELIEGACTYDSDTRDANAKQAELLAGKTAYVAGQKITGNMPNNGSVTGEISTKTARYTIPQGYHDGSGKVGISPTEQAKIVSANIREGVTILGVPGGMKPDEGESKQANKTVTPSKTLQTVLPDDGYTCLGQVTVNAIPYAENENASGGITVTIG